MQLGGAATFSFKTENPEMGEDKSGVRMALMPSFGYFVIRNLMLGGDFLLEKGFGDFPSIYLDVGFNFFVRYYFNFRSRVVPYVGNALGPHFAVPKDDQLSTIDWFSLKFPFGMLIALNRSVGLDIGTSVNIDFRLSDRKETNLLIPLGYLGVQAFF
jgi:hypothetical protein